MSFSLFVQRFNIQHLSEMRSPHVDVGLSIARLSEKGSEAFYTTWESHLSRMA